jgi:hypothetical protein
VRSTASTLSGFAPSTSRSIVAHSVSESLYAFFCLAASSRSAFSSSSLNFCLAASGSFFSSASLSGLSGTSLSLIVSTRALVASRTRI